MKLDDVKIKYHPKDWLTKKEEIRYRCDDHPEKRLPGYESETNPGYVDESTIDKRILRLVKAVNYMGIETGMGCEGHYAKDMKTYGREYGAPLINRLGSYVGLENVADLKIFIEGYNSKSKIKWKLILQRWEGDRNNSYSLTVKHGPKNKKEMKAAQFNADCLAQYLHESTKEAYAVKMKKTRV